MNGSLVAGSTVLVSAAEGADTGTEAVHPGRLGWRSLPLAAQLYIEAVFAAGGFALVAFFPREYPDPILFVVLLICACLTSVWKVNLPISLGSGSTLSMSYAANLASLLLLGPRHTMIIAVAGAWMQCTYKVKQPYPLYRTIFSVAAEALTMAGSGLTYGWLAGPGGVLDPSTLAKPLVVTIATYFFINTALVAGAIALSTGRPLQKVWREDFLWSGAGFMVAGTAGAIAALIVVRGEQWQAILMLAPVHLIYRTYGLFVGRLEDQRRHAAQTQELHARAVEALALARGAEQALANEKNQLTVALANMTRLEEMRNQLLEREHVARASAVRANRIKDQFLATVSHELRTPLTAILGWADLLRRTTPNAERRDRAVQSIYRSARRQAQLVDDLLDVARIVSGTLRIERAPVDLEEVVLDALQLVQPSADAKGVTIVKTGQPVGPFTGDALRLQQIVSNLLSNAVKFTPEGGTIYVRLRGLDRVVELVVADSGCGIAQEFLGSVFDPFRQADASTTRRQSGLGLGLSIVKHLVEAHDGTVNVQSAGEGCGATFVVRLPTIRVSRALPQAPNDALEGALSGPPDTATALDGISVLVVDDDDECREVTAAQLEGHRAVVMTAASSAQAFDVLQREHVDVLIADIAMPGEDGYALVQRLRRSTTSPNASVPAAAVTALARTEDQQQALDAGFQLHLTKPVDERSLVSAVATLNKLNSL